MFSKNGLVLKTIKLSYEGFSIEGKMVFIPLASWVQLSELCSWELGSFDLKVKRDCLTGSNPWRDQRVFFKIHEILSSVIWKSRLRRVQVWICRVHGVVLRACTGLESSLGFFTGRRGTLQVGWQSTGILTMFKPLTCCWVPPMFHVM